MRKVNSSIVGPDPIHADVFLGLDGQLWKWGPSGQHTVASGGEEAVSYAVSNGFPESVVDVIRSRGLLADPRRR